MKHPRPCSVHGCPEVTKERFCPTHQVEHAARYERERGSAASRGYDRKWRRVREAFLRSVGWRCKTCGDRPFDTSRMHVHHLDRQPKGPNRFAFGNLEAQCISCHAKLHASEGAA